MYKRKVSHRTELLYFTGAFFQRDLREGCKKNFKPLMKRRFHTEFFPYPHSLTERVLHVRPVFVVGLKVLPRLVCLLLLLARRQCLGGGHGPREDGHSLERPLDRVLVLLEQRPLEPVEDEEELGEETEESLKDFEVSELPGGLLAGGGGGLAVVARGEGSGHL